LICSLCLPVLTIKNSLPALGIVGANQDERTGDRGGGLELISRNAGAYGHAVEATGVLVQLRQYRVQYVGVKPARGAIKSRCYSISQATKGGLILHDRQHGLRKYVLDRTHNVHVHTRSAHPRFQHEIRLRNCPEWAMGSGQWAVGSGCVECGRAARQEPKKNEKS